MFTEEGFQGFLFTIPHCLLFQEVELWEACWDGQIKEIHHLLMAGVNVNILTSFVSSLLDMAPTDTMLV